MKREQRLRKPADFRRVREFSPRGSVNRLLAMYGAANELGITRVGITVSGRIGNAVTRNKVRRRLHEAVRQRWPQLPLGADIVVAARPASATASWDELNVALDSVLKRLQVVTR